MKIYNNFVEGAMNKDIEVRLLTKGQYLDAKNIRIQTPDGQNSRSVRLPLGNTQITSTSFSGTGPTCIGSCIDRFSNKIYYSVATNSHSYIIELDVDTNTERTIVSDTNGSTPAFDFTQDMYVDMAVINDNDNGTVLLSLTDGVNEPKLFDINRVQLITADTYELLDVSLIKAFPVQEPTVTLGVTASNQENNIESKFLSFAFRYKYEDGQWSALSTFSNFAFLPDNFSYNYKEGTNSAMFNDFSKADIGINTGPSQVTDVQLIVKESGSNTAYIVETYNKADEVWGDGTTQTVSFDNSRIFRALEEDELTRVYDNVPTSARSLTIAGNRIFLGDYTEGYDLEYLGSPIDTVFSLGYASAVGTSGTVHETVKTNRDYEVGIYYLDGIGRKTTPITSDGNTTFVPYSVADQKNNLVVTIDSNTRPPDWATRYGFYLKQSKVDYDVIAPLTFYRDGVFAWVKLEGNDNQKVVEGEFIYVKSDTTGLKVSTIRARVLEVSEQPENFLEAAAPDPFEVLQEGGTYMRIQVEGFALSEEAVSTYQWIGYSFRSASTGNNFVNDVSYIEEPYYDGVDLDDLTASGTYSGSDDIRYEVQIDGTGSPNTFQWREYNVSTDVVGAWTTLVNITGAAQTLSNGLQVTFGQTTGHTLNDSWFISAKSQTRANEFDKGRTPIGEINARALMIYEGKELPDEGIRAGATIKLTYDDSASASQVKNKQGFVQESLTSSRDYPNIEEWFFGDNIISQLTYPVDTTRIIFRRGSLQKSNGEQVAVASTGRMYMIISSPAYYDVDSSSEIRIDVTMNITEFDNSILFETVPEDNTTDVFYELPTTYFCTAGIHLGVGGNGDTNQSFGVTDAVINLTFFNAFGWYNGFESYKIGDTFNAKSMVLDTKAVVPVEDYKSVTRVASITYGGRYEGTTQLNELSQFNLSLANFKDLEINYGAIRKMHPRDTDLVVFQHDKTSRVLLDKSILFNADGSGNVSQNLNVLGQQVAYTGEYGIGQYPESFAFFGTRMYHIDKDRGALMRLSNDGYTEVSQNGLMDYFRTLPAQTQFVGGYDPYNDEYLINVDSSYTLAYKEGSGFPAFYEYVPERLVGLNNRLYSIKNGQVWLHDDNTTRNNFYGVQTSASITTVFNDVPTNIKHFKAVNLESTIAWAVAITTNQSTGSIASTEFEGKEGEQYAYIRQAEDTALANLSQATSVLRGIGEVTAINTLTVSFANKISRGIQIGDSVAIDGGATLTTIGDITAIDRASNTIDLTSVAGLSVTDLAIAVKDTRTEGEAIKGYYAQMVLTTPATTDETLFAVRTEVVRSSD